MGHTSRVTSSDELWADHADELKQFGDPPRFDIRMFPLLGMDNDRSTVTTRADTQGLREIVEQIGMQFKRELGYDFPPFDPDDPDRDAVLINSRKFLATFPVAAGAAEFMRDDAGWIMTWIWLHPYERGGQLIERAWRNWKPATVRSGSKARSLRRWRRSCAVTVSPTSAVSTDTPNIAGFL